MGKDDVAGPEGGIRARDDLARHVDARDERADPGDLAGRDRGQRILVIDAGPEDANFDVALEQVRPTEVPCPAVDTLPGPLGDERAEALGDPGARQPRHSSSSPIAALRGSADSTMRTGHDLPFRDARVRLWADPILPTRSRITSGPRFSSSTRACRSVQSSWTRPPRG